jgi:hypothetical protein
MRPQKPASFSQSVKEKKTPLQSILFFFFFLILLFFSEMLDLADWRVLPVG